MIKLICLDLDGVLINSQAFWMKLHKAYGTLEEGTALTKAYVTTDYAKLVEEVCGRLWRGKSQEPYLQLVHSLEYMKGIPEFFLELDRFRAGDDAVPRAIITGSAYEVAQRVQKDFGITFIFANQLLFEHGRATGEFKWPVGHGGYTKAEVIEQLCDDLEILPQEVLMIADSEGDLESFRICGTSIAFNSQSSKLKEEATYVVDSDNLRDVIPILQKIREEQGAGAPTFGPAA